MVLEYIYLYWKDLNKKEVSYKHANKTKISS